MSTCARRIIGSAMAVLLAAVVPSAFGQSYTPTPDEVSATVTQNSIGTGTEASPGTTGLPSVDAGGRATVRFDFDATVTVYHAGGAAMVQYRSDLEPDWTTLAGLNSTSGPHLFSEPVTVSNLSSLQFRMFVTAGVQNQGSYATVSGTATNFSVSVP